MVPPPATAAERPRRADARRNRERLLAVAAEVFAEQGLDVGVAEISRRSGVGSATLFRNFPTKDDLVNAVLEQRLAEVEGLLDDAGEVADPWEALVGFMRGFAQVQSRDRALLEAFAEVFATMPAEQLEAHFARFATGMDALLRRAQAAGAVRDDLVAEDVKALVCGAAGMAVSVDPTRPELADRYLGLILDGMRPGGATPLPVGPPAPHLPRCG